MARIELQHDFKDFLKLLNSNGVEYLIVGGYAVAYYGHPRATGDLDIWIGVNVSNAGKTALAVREFGMPAADADADLFTQENKIIRMGFPPVRIEVLTGVSGVEFADCYKRRKTVDVDGIMVNFISLDDLKRNKKAAARHQDLEDLEHLPPEPEK
ncbi:MAG TPA: nucleotidyltransferase [bacterium]|nr:nucleotidyltransferase [bacterium]